MTQIPKFIAGLLLALAAWFAGSLLANQLTHAVQSPGRQFDATAKREIDDFRESERARLKALEERDAETVRRFADSIRN